MHSRMKPNEMPCDNSYVWIHKHQSSLVHAMLSIRFPHCFFGFSLCEGYGALPHFIIGPTTKMTTRIDGKLFELYFWRMNFAARHVESEGRERDVCTLDPMISANGFFWKNKREIGFQTVILRIDGFSSRKFENDDLTQPGFHSTIHSTSGTEPTNRKNLIIFQFERKSLSSRSLSFKLIKFLLENILPTFHHGWEAAILFPFIRVKFEFIQKRERERKRKKTGHKICWKKVSV